MREIPVLDNKFYQLILIIFCALSLSLIIPGITYADEAGISPGDTASDFSLNELGTEREISLYQIEDQYILLNFWTTWCPACQEQMPKLQQLEDEHGSEVSVITVNIGQPAPEVGEYIEDGEFSFMVLIDEEEKVANQYSVRGVPTTFILNEEKVIEARHVGPLNYEQKLELLNLN